MNGTLVLVAATLSVVLAAGMAPAFAYYPVNDFNDEIAEAPTRIPIANSDYDYDYDNNLLLVNYSGFPVNTAGYGFSMLTCVADGDMPNDDLKGESYGDACDRGAGSGITTSSTGHLSFSSPTPNIISADESYFVTIIVGTGGLTHHTQFIMTVGATSADGLTVDNHAPLGLTATGNSVHQYDGRSYFLTSASNLLLSDPANPKTPTGPNIPFHDLRILAKPQYNSTDVLLNREGTAIRYEHSGDSTANDVLRFTVASVVTGMRSSPAQLTIPVEANTAPDFRLQVTRNVDHNGTLQILYTDPHRFGDDPADPNTESIIHDGQQDRFIDPVLTRNPTHGTVEFINGTGANADFAIGFIYTHNSPSTDNDVFAFRVSDEHGAQITNDVTVTLTIGGSELIQVQDHDFSVLRGGTARIPLEPSWITADPDGDGDFFAIEFSVRAEHANVRIDSQRETLLYEHRRSSDAETDTFTFRVTNSEGVRTGSMTSEVTILSDLEGNGFERTVYNQGDTITILFNETSTSGRPILDDYGLVTFRDITFTDFPEHNSTDVALNGDGTGIIYVHNGSGGDDNTEDTFAFTVLGAASGSDYTSNAITAKLEIIAPSPPSRANSTITISPNTDESTPFLFADILTDPNIDPDSGDPLPIAVVERDLDVAISDPEFIYPIGQEGIGVPIGLEYTPNDAAIENGTDVIRFTITDEDGLKSTIEYRVEFGSSGGGDDDQQWKRKPTFGESHLTGALIVENGFSFNGNRLDITDNWHTDFARTSSIIGEHNTVTIKTYANDPLRRVSLSLAIPEIGALHDAETDIHVMLQRNYSDASGYNIINVMHEQKEQLVNATHTTASIGPAKCTGDSEDERCYEVEISFVVTAPLKHDVVAITAVDSKRYSTTTYINEGVVFEGDALLPAHTHQMTQKRGNQHPAETIQLTQQDRRFELWEDQHGLLWTKNTHGTWMRLTHPDFERPDDPEMSIKTRLHSDFASMVQYERDRALLVFDSASISSEPDEPFTYEYRLTPSKLSDPEILERMRVQSELAELTYGGN